MRSGLLLSCLLAGTAAATPAFDPTTSLSVWDDSSPLTTDVDGLPLWDRIELHRDSDATLFVTEDIAPGQAWQDDSVLSPHVAALFGGGQPASSDFLLHFAPGWALAPVETPVILVPGAATAASGVYAPLARYLAGRGRAVFAVTFPHPHGDCFQQAEQLADAVARVRELTGAAQVDLVGHSKGGIAASIYLGNRSGVDWGSEGRGGRYADRGTGYRDDVRRFVALAVPFGGVDTAFRWTATHVLTGLGEDPVGPSAWSTYYPYTTTAPLVYEDLSAVDFWAAGGDAWPGQAQLLAEWDDVHALPGGRSELGLFAYQQDWLTTWTGGFGFYSWSEGIASAIEEGGGLIGRLGPFDPSIELSVLAGVNPLIPLDQPSLPNDTLGEGWSDWLGQDTSDYQDLVEGPMADDFPDLAPTEAEYQALADGNMALGEISGLSDGLLFTASATATAPLLADGATLVDETLVDLSHLDVLFASVPIGQALLAEGGHLASLGQRYVDADTLGWVAAQLERGEDAGDDDDDSAAPGDDDDDDDDSAAPGDDDDDDSAAPGDDDDSAEPDVPWTGCGCATSTGAPTVGLWLLPPLLLGRRRRR